MGELKLDRLDPLISGYFRFTQDFWESPPRGIALLFSIIDQNIKSLIDLRLFRSIQSFY
jgi:hypothetical protein